MNNKLMSPLFFNNLETIDQILNNVKTELSASYTNKLKKSNDKNYDFVAEDIVGNHVALVERGRCGEDVRIYNHHSAMERKNIIKERLYDDYMKNRIVKIRRYLKE